MKDISDNFVPESITPELIARLADVAKLDLTEDEQAMANEYLRSILGYISRIDAIDTNGVEPCGHLSALCDAYRNDESSEPRGGFDFRVPNGGREAE